ncbi:MAG TPA: hypothetical protein VH593_27345 [Ktedonobacteraceae bacterium]
MSWFDEAVALRRLRQHHAASGEINLVVDTEQRRRREVETFDPLIQRLLSEYGEATSGKSLLRKNFLVQLERPGEGAAKCWNWHWHLYNLTKLDESIEVHPNFAPDGIIQGFTLRRGKRHIEILDTDEAVLKEGLVSIYLP